jgi:rhomboid protease GluP
MLKSMFNFLVLNTIIGMTAARVDMAAHLGGFAGGMICGLILSQPLLVPELFQRRRIRNIICLITAIVLLPAAFFLLPDPPVDILAELQRLAIIENEVYDTFYDAQDSAAAGEIDNKEFADRVELRVLRPWDDYIRDVDHLMTLENANQDTMQRLALYLQRRKECWQTLVEGLRENNAEKLQRARQLSEESDVLLGERVKANAQPQE